MGWGEAMASRRASTAAQERLEASKAQHRAQIGSTMFAVAQAASTDEMPAMPSALLGSTCSSCDRLRRRGDVLEQIGRALLNALPDDDPTADRMRLLFDSISEDLAKEPTHG